MLNKDNFQCLISEPLCSLRSRRYSRAQENGQLEIPPAQKLHILSSAHRTHGSAHLNVFVKLFHVLHQCKIYDFDVSYLRLI